MTAVNFRGVSLNLIQIQLGSLNLAELQGALDTLTGNAPDFFDNELAILDCAELPVGIDMGGTDWAAICRLLELSGLRIVGVHGVSESLALVTGLPRVESLSNARQVKLKAEPALTIEPTIVEVPVEVPVEVRVEVPGTPVPTLLIDKPLRSGQRVYARGGDIIVTAMVSAGAEIIADGNIHVYAPLRGRALAGAAGNKDARIFAFSLEAELVSVAGVYRTFDTDTYANLRGKAVEVRLSPESGHNQLVVEAIH